MYRPIDSLVKENATTDDLQSTLCDALHGIGGIADTLYSCDLSCTDEYTINALGAALLLLNGVVDLSTNKLLKMQDHKHKSGTKK